LRDRRSRADAYVDVSHVRQAGKTYTRYLLRESFRDDGKVKHRTIANLSGCSAAEIEAIRLALRHKDNLSALGTNPSEIVIKQGLSYGAVHVVYEVARSLGIVAALGTTRDGLWRDHFRWRSRYDQGPANQGSSRRRLSLHHRHHQAAG
jgi:hypothetical protein